VICVLSVRIGFTNRPDWVADTLPIAIEGETFAAADVPIAIELSVAFAAFPIATADIPVDVPTPTATEKLP
jgi:hypothetical protein